MTAIIKFYHKSAVRQQGLAEIQSILEDPTFKFKLSSATRWLSRAQAIDAVRRSLSSLLVSLDREASERADATAVGLVTLCRNYMFVAIITFMSDIMSHVHKMSLIFQMETVDFFKVKALVDSCIKAVKNLKTTSGPAMQTTDAVLVRLEEQHIPISNVTDLSKGKFKNEVHIKFCDALIQHLERRLPDLPLIKAFQLFDRQQLPYSQEELGTYGDEFIAELCDHYPRIDQCTALHTTKASFSICITHRQSEGNLSKL